MAEHEPGHDFAAGLMIGLGISTLIWIVAIWILL